MCLLEEHDRLVAHLRELLRGPLPGARAHGRMAPRPRRGWRPGRVPADTRPAAALLLLFPVGGAPHLPLTLRRPDLNAHAGQVSLPGGAVDVGESPEGAAVREAHEEIGADPDAIELLGRLTPLHIPVSGFVLTPIVGATAAAQAWRPQPSEVTAIRQIPLAGLAEPRAARLERWQRSGYPALVPCFRVAGLEIWGATAMVLAELLELLGAPPRPVLS